ncbi:hypothetical protein [Pseudoxanthomonas suwonensis]|uniref:Uncharacterized protein n=1 Tax=Pseudoxanthomonas suwonensis TaxID=314722 RepID=A0A0E3Z135_9GAMM|nr:hypothetical protein [Pseudoxanthomonas suwonensis]AKC86377.1 hypothetical protein WQ53_05920 [Pseudoxanthomonas suwonensis]
MRILVATAIAATGIIIAAVSTAIASQSAPSTFEQCAVLLPQGKVYTFEITGSVDATGAAPKLSGEMSVSDGTEVDRTDESAAFGQCVAKLLR